MIKCWVQACKMFSYNSKEILYLEIKVEALKCYIRVSSTAKTAV